MGAYGIMWAYMAKYGSTWAHSETDMCHWGTTRAYVGRYELTWLACGPILESCGPIGAAYWTHIKPNLCPYKAQMCPYQRTWSRHGSTLGPMRAYMVPHGPHLGPISTHMGSRGPIPICMGLYCTRYEFNMWSHGPLCARCGPIWAHHDYGSIWSHVDPHRPLVGSVWLHGPT